MKKYVSVLTSRKFWAVIVALSLLLISAVRPDVELSQDEVTSTAMLVVSYVVGTLIENETASGWQKIKVLLKSRKFWALSLGLCLIYLRAFGVDIPIPEEYLVEIMIVISTFIVGTGAEVLMQKVGLLPTGGK